MKKIKNKFTYGVFIVLLCCCFFVLGVASSNFLAPNTVSDPALANFIQYYNILKNNWYFYDDEVDKDLFAKAMIEALNRNGDGYTYFQQYVKPSDEPAKLGIGITIYSKSPEYIVENNYLYYKVTSEGVFVLEVNINSPAYQAGIMQGDSLLGLYDSEDNLVTFEGKLFRELNDYIAGLEHTSVKLLVRRGQEDIELIVNREYYNRVFAFSTPVDSSICASCYSIKLTEFSDSANRQFANELDKIAKPSETDLVIDLRGNPGGYVSAMESIADLFLPKNNVLAYYKDKNDKKSVAAKTKTKDYTKFNSITIAMDDDSASASEAFTLALDYYSDKLGFKFQTAGEVSYGKGIAQTTVYLSDGSYIQYTFAKVYDPSGNVCIHEVGITPDVEYNINQWEINQADIYYQEYQKQYDSILASARELGNR